KHNGGGEPQKFLTRRAGQGTIEKTGLAAGSAFTAGKGKTHDVQDQTDPLHRCGGGNAGGPAGRAGPGGRAHLTPDSTVAELHGNEGIVGSGFDSWDRGTLLPEQ